jgi:hypothetical protein
VKLRNDAIVEFEKLDLAFDKLAGELAEIDALLPKAMEPRSVTKVIYTGTPSEAET